MPQLDATQDIQNQFDKLNQTIMDVQNRLNNCLQMGSPISVSQLPQGPGSGLNADRVDGINASRQPAPNVLVPTDSTGKFPLSTIPLPSGTQVIVSGTPASPEIAFWTSGSQITGNADLKWDNTNHQLVIGQNSFPSNKLNLYATTGADYILAGTSGQQTTLFLQVQGQSPSIRIDGSSGFLSLGPGVSTSGAVVYADNASASFSGSIATLKVDATQNTSGSNVFGAQIFTSGANLSGGNSTALELAADGASNNVACHISSGSGSGTSDYAFKSDCTAKSRFLGSLGLKGDPDRTLMVGATSDTTNVNLRVNGLTTTGANTGTLNNCPHSGDPDLYLEVNVNGTTYAVPAFALT